MTLPRSRSGTFLGLAAEEASDSTRPPGAIEDSRGSTRIESRPGRPSSGRGGSSRPSTIAWGASRVSQRASSGRAVARQAEDRVPPPRSGPWASVAIAWASPRDTRRRPVSVAVRPVVPSTAAAVTCTSAPSATSGSRMNGRACTSEFRSGCARRTRNPSSRSSPRTAATSRGHPASGSSMSRVPFPFSESRRSSWAENRSTRSKASSAPETTATGTSSASSVRRASASADSISSGVVGKRALTCGVAARVVTPSSASADASATLSAGDRAPSSMPARTWVCTSIIRVAAADGRRSRPSSSSAARRGARHAWSARAYVRPSIPSGRTGFAQTMYRWLAKKRGWHACRATSSPFPDSSTERSSSSTIRVRATT